jgi:hypothetical protein
MYHAFFKTKGTPGRLTPKRFLILILLFFLYPLWQFSIRIAYLLDSLFYPEYQFERVNQPIFIIGNFRSGTTFLHRLLVKDREATSLTSWEMYVAPSIIGRKIIRWGMKLNYAIGNPAQWLLDAFDRIMAEYSTMHRFGLTEPEEDGQVLFHIFSSYDLLALFPFPDLVRQYIYYDDQIPLDVRENDMHYYHEVLKRHIFSHRQKRYISKNPSYSPKVKSLHKEFPDAKFINLVRNPLQVIPSSISLFSNHLHTYGEPETDYALQDTVIEHSKHWYLYPHRYLKKLPRDQYIRIRYKDLIADPKGTVERIYNQFGLDIGSEYELVLQEEAVKAQKYRSSHRYSLRSMGLNKRRILREFKNIYRQLQFRDAKQEK